MADDPQTIAEPAPPPAAIYGPPPSYDPIPMPSQSPPTLQELEVKAMLGQLTPEQILDLRVRLREESDLAQKDKISRLLMTNAWSAGDKASWEKHVTLHLGSISQSDPDLCYKYSLYLSKQNPLQAEEVIRWADVALSHRDQWTGATLTSRVFNLHRLRAMAAKSLWAQAAEQGLVDDVEPARERAKAMALEWAAVARESGKDPAAAMEICVLAGGSANECGGAEE